MLRWLTIASILTGCSARPTVEAAPPKPQVEHQPIHPCDPVVACDAPVGVGEACGEVSDGCPGAFSTCVCDEGLNCADGVCLTPDGADFIVPSTEEIDESFVLCEGTANVGQTKALGGLTCDDVCSRFGFQSCVERHHQPTLQACTMKTSVTGTCGDRFEAGSVNECVCATGE